MGKRPSGPQLNSRTHNRTSGPPAKTDRSFQIAKEHPMPLRRVPKLTADELEAWAFDYPGSTIEPDPETRTVHLYDINGREVAWAVTA